MMHLKSRHFSILFAEHTHRRSSSGIIVRHLQIIGGKELLVLPADKPPLYLEEKIDGQLFLSEGLQDSFRVNWLSPRTIDNYRDALFIKLNVKSRVGLAIYAIKSGVVTLEY